MQNLHNSNPPWWVDAYSEWFNTADDIPEHSSNYLMLKRERNALIWFSRAIDFPSNEFLESIESIRRKGSFFGEARYTISKKPKRGGGYRKICKPQKDLARIQDKLNKCLSREYQPDEDICGFSGGDVAQALLPHVDGTWILKVDFKDAFPTISKAAVQYALRKYFSWYISKSIADLATYQNELPQGAPSSPRIFDIVCTDFDVYMRKLVSNYGARYTRYADNIFVSVISTEFPHTLTNGILKAIENRRSYRDSAERRRGPKFSWHKLRICKMTGSTVRALGLNILNGKLHNTRNWKKQFRKKIAHVKYLLDNGLPYDTEFGQLEGMIQFGREDTLPSSLIRSFEAVYHQVYRIRRPWVYAITDTLDTVFYVRPSE